MIQFKTLVEAINQSIQYAARSVEQNRIDRINQFFDLEKDNNGNVTSYIPKSTTTEFLTRTTKGIETVKVQVPLIVLSAIASPHISKTDNNEELFVEFEPISKIEILLKNDETPEGLKKVIEGYERALRAQIPG